ncbi:MFS transporter [Massilia cavernae]|uniref:MFS transporter n=1 Tax=Massilia cavernae TaxID=2320864 RepID=UPI001E48810B|nr:MFS transporter [Massilia cavernae]
MFAAIVPALVPRTQLPEALALNGVAMNASRIAGPLIAGALIASAGSVCVFVLNAMLSLLCGALLMRWRRAHQPSPLGRERLFSAIRVGVQFVSQSAPVRATLLRTVVFYFNSIAMLALLPLLAHGRDGPAASMFTVLLACMGVGAIAGALLLPRMRQLVSRNGLVVAGSLAQAGAAAVVALNGTRYLAAPAMLVAGVAWITAANSLAVSVQLALPDWVRARGMSIFQMAMMGACALGAARVGPGRIAAQRTGERAGASVVGAVMALATLRLAGGGGNDADPTPSNQFKVPVAATMDTAGHVQITIEYRIDAARAAEFRALMRESRRSRLQQGALSWELLRSASDPACYIERIVDESWIEHLRHFDRVTTADVALRDRKFAFHVGAGAPVVTRCFVEDL